MCQWGILSDDPCDPFFQLPEVPLSSFSELGDALIEITLPVPEPQLKVTTGSQSHFYHTPPIPTTPSHSVTEAVVSPKHAGYSKEAIQEPLPLYGGLSFELMPCLFTSLDDPLCH
jgi:hypothetical protein